MQVEPAVEQFCRGYFATSARSHHTQRAYAYDLSQFTEFIRPDTRIDSIAASDIESWSTRLREQGYATASMKRKLATLQVFFRYWIRRRHLSTSPMSQVRINFGSTRQLPRYLTRPEVSSLLEVAHDRVNQARLGHDGRIDRGFIALRNLALLRLLFATGIRVGEASALDVTDFCVDDNSFRILGKGGRCRLAFLASETAIDCQHQYLEIRQRISTSTSALFLNMTGKRLSTQGIAYALRSLAESASLSKRITPHMLRHTAATFLLRNGADLRIVQEFLGHASIVTTQRYTHVTKEDLVSALQRFHPGLALRTDTAAQDRTVPKERRGTAIDK